MMLHTKYQGLKPCGFRQKDFSHGDNFLCNNGIIRVILVEGNIRSLALKGKIYLSDYLNLSQWIKGFLLLLWWPFCLWNHPSHSGIGHYEE